VSSGGLAIWRTNPPGKDHLSNHGYSRSQDGWSRRIALRNSRKSSNCENLVPARWVAAAGHVEVTGGKASQPPKKFSLEVAGGPLKLYSRPCGRVACRRDGRRATQLA
jgi:hypothetical protein